MRHWADPGNLAGASFLTSAETTLRATDLPGLAIEGDQSVATSLRCLVDHLARRDIDAIVVDVSAPDVASAGFQVIRTVTPNLCMLDVEADARFHGRPRLLREASRRGVTRVNPLPHPFP